MSGINDLMSDDNDIPKINPLQALLQNKSREADEGQSKKDQKDEQAIDFSQFKRDKKEYNQQDINDIDNQVDDNLISTLKHEAKQDSDKQPTQPHKFLIFNNKPKIEAKQNNIKDMIPNTSAEIPGFGTLAPNDQNDIGTPNVTKQDKEYENIQDSVINKNHVYTEEDYEIAKKLPTTGFTDKNNPCFNYSSDGLTRKLKQKRSYIAELNKLPNYINILQDFGYMVIGKNDNISQPKTKIDNNFQEKEESNNEVNNDIKNLIILNATNKNISLSEALNKILGDKKLQEELMEIIKDLSSTMEDNK